MDRQSLTWFLNVRFLDCSRILQCQIALSQQDDWEVRCYVVGVCDAEVFFVSDRALLQ
jgi:hypothetical protein